MRALLHPTTVFLLLGLAWVAVDVARRPPVDAPTPIVVDEALVDALRRQHVARTGAPPTAAELDAALSDQLDQEILYREALAAGLAAGDPIVRRRLVQKMRFLLEDAPVGAPDEATLTTHLAAHPDRFARPRRVSFQHVFFRRERDDAAVQAARAALEGGADPAGLGDPFVHGAALRVKARDQLAGLMGGDFADAVVPAEPGGWFGPVPSSYGRHLVRVTEVLPGGAPTLAEARAEVEADWRRSARAAAFEAALERLRARHPVERRAAP